MKKASICLFSALLLLSSCQKEVATTPAKSPDAAQVASASAPGENNDVVIKVDLAGL